MTVTDTVELMQPKTLVVNGDIRHIYSIIQIHLYSLMCSPIDIINIFLTAWQKVKHDQRAWIRQKRTN